MKATEKTTAKGFGDPKNPLLVSCTSDPKESMPGMMDTVLNIGLNDETVESLAALTNNERFARDAYRRLIEGFGKVVLEIPDTEFEHVLHSAKEKARVKMDFDLTAGNLKEVAAQYKAIVKKYKGFDFPRSLSAAPPGHRSRLQELERQAPRLTTAGTKASRTPWAPRSIS